MPTHPDDAPGASHLGVLGCSRGDVTRHTFRPLMAERRKRGRLSRSGDFDRVYRDGRSHGNRFLVMYSFPRPDAPDQGIRLGVSVSRKVGGAAERNKVKRALREAFWRLDPAPPPGHDFVLVARPDVAGLVERSGTEGVAEALRELAAESGREAA